MLPSDLRIFAHFILSSLVNVYREYIKRISITFLGMCPIGFQWHANIKKCYSFQLSMLVAGTDIVKVCKDLHPEATPVEPRNQEEMNTIVNMAGMTQKVLIQFNIKQSEIPYVLKVKNEF